MLFFVVKRVLPMGIAAAALVVMPVDWEGPYLREADAVVGRPLTPVSYAGVARRTSRRTARRVSSRQSYPGAVTVLPAGCAAPVGGVYACGGASYRVVYDGPDVVYVPE